MKLNPIHALGALVIGIIGAALFTQSRGVVESSAPAGPETETPPDQSRPAPRTRTVRVEHVVTRRRKKKTSSDARTVTTVPGDVPAPETDNPSPEPIEKPETE